MINGLSASGYQPSTSLRRIGIQGGTFDPPHLVHLILGEMAVDSLGLDRLLFVPAADPPHKLDRHKTAVEHRLAMLERALAGNPRFSLSRVDVDRPGPHYSVDMVRLIGEQYPHAELFFVMGGDSFADFVRWYRPADLARLCQLAVMRRPGDSIHPELHAAVLPELSGRVHLLDAPLLDVSSTALVQRVRSGKSIRYFVPDAVREYIDQQRLYR